MQRQVCHMHYGRYATALLYLGLYDMFFNRIFNLIEKA